MQGCVDLSLLKHKERDSLCDVLRYWTLFCQHHIAAYTAQNDDVHRSDEEKAKLVQERAKTQLVQNVKAKENMFDIQVLR